MRIVGHMPGRRYAPLDLLTVEGDGHLLVTDGARRTYCKAIVNGSLTVVVGGALGTHQATLGDESIPFQVEAQTQIVDGSGRHQELLTMLLYTMLGERGEESTCLWDGKIYRYFISWLRDHVHVMKGMKYFSGELRSAIELYRDSHREDGMIYDNCHRRGLDENYWSVRFAEGGFYRSIADDTFELKRIPVENDVEYLFVEGLYYTWKATGDDAWMAKGLDAAQKALEYSVNDTDYRFSKSLGLLKRGYTIDTWDFQADIDCNVEGDIMRVRPGTSRFGAMFGDTTGYVSACRMLTEMLSAAGRAAESAPYLDRADKMLARLNEVSWRGTHYQMHVPEDAQVVRDLGVDEPSQVSLSNAYSLNRGIGREKCLAIIESYRRILSSLPEGSPGEWYTIYPPFERGFGGHSDKWQYMNASVTPIVAGELAHGAFENGREAYGADILGRLVELGQRFGGQFHCSYTGSLPEAEPQSFSTIDLARLVNCDVRGPGEPGVPGWENTPNDLRELPTGLQSFSGVPFDVPTGVRGAIGLAEVAGFAESVEIPIGRHAGSLYFFHTVSGGPVAGMVTLHYADGSVHRQAVIRGRDVIHWWMPDLPAKTGRRNLDIGWKGKNDVLTYVGVSVWAMDNPHPDRELQSVILEAAPEGVIWYVLGLTTSAQEGAFPTSPISFGIPDGWGAAAVVYALIEGLAGVVDASTAFDDVIVSPRWVAASETSAKVTVTYPASGGYVAYEYAHDPDAKSLSLTITGSGKRCRVRLMLPAGSRCLNAPTEVVEGTTYAILDVEPNQLSKQVILYDESANCNAG